MGTCTAGHVYTTFARHKSYGLQAQQRTVHMPSTLHPLDIPNSEKGYRTQKAVGKVSEQERQTGRQSLAGKLEVNGMQQTFLGWKTNAGKPIPYRTPWLQRQATTCCKKTTLCKTTTYSSTTTAANFFHLSNNNSK
ncbi:uncharacterized protein LOC144916268 [Branchiostoma floridae x Branchiostoma belcheri]